jgi:hypothetical protein
MTNETIFRVRILNQITQYNGRGVDPTTFNVGQLISVRTSGTCYVTTNGDYIDRIDAERVNG